MSQKRNELHVVQAYLTAFCDGNIDDVAMLLDKNLCFTGPLHQFNNASDYISSLRNDPPLSARFDIKRISSRDNCVFIQYDYIKPGQKLFITQEFIIENDKITETRLDFDSAAMN